jgi:hypothetical protein
MDGRYSKTIRSSKGFSEMNIKNKGLSDYIRLATSKLKDYISGAKDWFVSKIHRSQTTRLYDIVKDKDKIDYLLQYQEKGRTTDKILLGDMVHFWYDPKWKKVLPYYDRFPLIFPLNYYKDGFLGINFHYLDIDQRIILLDALLDNIESKLFDDKKKMKISYGILLGASKYESFKPCLKRYLYTHIRSPFIKIYPNEWQTAIFLNTAKFEKKNKEYVWEQSRKMY